MKKKLKNGKRKQKQKPYMKEERKRNHFFKKKKNTKTEQTVHKVKKNDKGTTQTKNREKQ